MNLKELETDVYLFDSDQVAYSFIFYPKDKTVRFNPRYKYEVFQHFVRLGFEVDLSEIYKSDPDNGYFTIKSSPFATEDETLGMIDLLREQLVNASLEQRELEYQQLLLQNWNNVRDKPLNKQVILNKISKMKNDPSVTRVELAEYLNRFNLELARHKDFPLITVSTKPKSVIAREGTSAIGELFEKGKLIYYTDIEYLDKLRKYEQKQKKVIDERFKRT